MRFKSETPYDLFKYPCGSEEVGAGRYGGVCGHARTVPIITLFIPGTPLKTTHLQKHA